VSGYWRSPRGENHGTDSKPGDVWVKVEFDGAGHFDYSWGETTYQIEIGKDYLRVHEGGDCLFVVELQEAPSNDVIRGMIKTYYVGRQDGEGRGRTMLQHQLRELLGAAMSKP
jgi:hypothetical protein